MVKLLSTSGYGWKTEGLTVTRLGVYLGWVTCYSSCISKDEEGNTMTRKLTKADIPELEKAVRVDREIAKDSTASKGARAQAQANIEMVEKTIEELKNS